MRIKNLKLLAGVVACITTMQLSVVSCSDDPGLNNYYTTTKEYASDYLMNREQFSQFVEILRRATGERGDLRLIDMLGTYGSYTVFAPTNDAVNKMLKQKQKISIDDLTKEECDTIALNSIIEQSFFTTDYSNAQYPKANMLEHIMSISCDTLQKDGETLLKLIVNKTSEIVHADDSVCNGVVHTMNEVVSTSNNLLPTVMEEDSTISIYNEAFKITKVNELMELAVDETYGFKTNQDRIDSCTWTNNALCIHTAVEYDNVAYPEKRYFNFTAFVVQDKVLKEKHGITKVLGKDDPTSLEYWAHHEYDRVYPEDKDNDDYTDRKNALNRFMSYHVLDRLGTYYTLTAIDNYLLVNNFNRRKWDVADWYETLMPHSIMKFSFPSGSQAGLYINRRGVQSRADERGVFIPGVKVADVANGPLQPNAVNGVYHYISDYVAYNEKTQTEVLNERIRLDCTTLSPDFMTKLTDGETARGHSSDNPGQKNMYGNGGQGQNAATNTDHCVGFKPGYARNFDFDNKTHLHCRVRVLNYWSYQGDEVTIKGPFDVSVKLPSVPAGTYEVRLMTCVDFASRGIVQCYIDGIAQGIPFDMRPGGVALFGFKTDEALGDDEAIAAFDKSIHNLGWMKGPGCYYPGYKTSFGGTPMRNLPNTIRKVLGTFYTDGKSDHYLRLQQRRKEGGELNFDFIEICPSSVYADEYYAEDKW